MKPPPGPDAAAPAQAPAAGPVQAPAAPAQAPAAGPAQAPATGPAGSLPSIWLRRAAVSWASGDQPDCRGFHRAFPGYAPTPLREAAGLAGQLGAATVLVKDESQRLGLPAFKVLGASWGVVRALYERLGAEPPPGAALAALERQSGRLRQLRLLAATDGNHGRAVARMARLLGLPAVILVPAAVGPHVTAAIAAEGAQVRAAGASYDEAVAAAAALAASDQRQVLVQDTSWPGYERIPAWIAEGYRTLFLEIDDQLAGAGHGHPDLVVVPAGVGSLLGTAIRHYRAPSASGRTALLAVEPVTAACVQASMRAGRPVTVPTGVTVLEGLNCGSVSPAAWPAISGGLDAAITVTDADALGAAHVLAGLGISAGPCGAAALAGLSAAVSGPTAQTAREALRITAASTVVLLSTEGRRRSAPAAASGQAWSGQLNVPPSDAGIS
jgi:diaminopropionate ammonia-lyase